MIGLLQSGTGIGRGICLPIVSRGLFEARAVAPERKPDTRATPGEPRREEPSAVAAFGAMAAIGRLLGCRRCLPLPAERRARGCCPAAEGGCGWRCTPFDVRSTAATLGGGGAVAAPGTGVVPGLPEALAVEGGGPPESPEGPLAEDEEPPEGDAGGLGEAAGGLLVGGTETLPEDAPGSDTLTRGVPDEDASGSDTLTKGVARRRRFRQRHADQRRPRRRRSQQGHIDQGGTRRGPVGQRQAEHRGV